MSSASTASTPEKRSRESAMEPKSDEEPQNHTRQCVPMRKFSSQELLASDPKLITLARACDAFNGSIRDDPIDLSKKLYPIFIAIHNILPGGRFDDLSADIYNCGFSLLLYLAKPNSPETIIHSLFRGIESILNTFSTNQVALDMLSAVSHNIKVINEEFLRLDNFGTLIPRAFDVKITYCGIQNNTGHTRKSFINTGDDYKYYWDQVLDAVQRMGHYAKDPVDYTGLDPVPDCWVPSLAATFVRNLTNFLNPDFIEPEKSLNGGDDYDGERFYFYNFGPLPGMYMSSCIQSSLILACVCIEASETMRHASNLNKADPVKNVLRAALRCVEDMLHNYPEDDLDQLRIAEGLRVHIKLVEDML